MFAVEKAKKGGVESVKRIINPFSFDLISERGDAWREEPKRVL
jgi:hypothetical protein